MTTATLPRVQTTKNNNFQNNVPVWSKRSYNQNILSGNISVVRKRKKDTALGSF